MAEAITVIEAALAERRAGSMASLPRTRWEIPPSALTITPGGFGGLGKLGFRVYLPGTEDDQLTAVWNTSDGTLEGILLGPELGTLRTGAIGGVAVKWMAAREVPTAGFVGAGTQAHAQLLALRAVHPELREVRVFRRDPKRRRETAARWSEETGLVVRPEETAQAAVQDASVVVLATDSSTPVVEAEWLAPGAHVNTLGPKYRDGSEIGLDVIEIATEIACDFPEQYRREEDFFLQGTPWMDRIRDLAKVAEHPSARAPSDRTVFLSHGLAGTEVAVAHRALVNARRLGIGTELAA
jgi:alanine dehydrogenase